MRTRYVIARPGTAGLPSRALPVFLSSNRGFLLDEYGNRKRLGKPSDGRFFGLQVSTGLPQKNEYRNFILITF